MVQYISNFLLMFVSVMCVICFSPDAVAYIQCQSRTGCKFLTGQGVQIFVTKLIKS